MQHIVTDNASLENALLSAQSGDEVLLKSGDVPYEIRINPLHELQGVSFSSFDPEDPATIGVLKIKGGHDLTFDGFRISSNDIDVAEVRDISVYSSSNITIRNSVLEGDAEGPVTLAAYAEFGDDAKAQSAVFVRGVDGFVFENNSMSHYNFGIYMDETQNVSIVDNDISRLQGDGLQMSEVRDVLIEGNNFHDFLGTDHELNHMDMIQMWTTSTETASENVTVRGNYFDTGDGIGTQTIHMRNERVDMGEAGEELFYRNITITDNVIYNSTFNAINIGETFGLEISNNTVIGNPDSGVLAHDEIVYLTPSIRVSGASQEVSITSNAVGNIVFKGEAPADVVVDGNILIDYNDPSQDNYVGNLFLNAEFGGDVDLAGLRAMPGGLLDGSGVGATATVFDSTPDELTPAITVTKVNGSETHFRFDATLTADANGFVDADAGSFVWTFADGVVLEGQVVERAFADFGLEPVLLSVEANGATAHTSGSVKVTDPVLLDIKFGSEEISDISAYASTLSYDSTFAEADGFHVHDGEAFEVTRFTDQIFGLSQFSLGFDLKRDSATDGEGIVAYITKSFMLKLDDGALSFELTNGKGETFTLASDAGVLADTDWHRVMVAFDGVGGSLQIFVDGVAVAETAASGLTQAQQSWGLSFGFPWGAGLNGYVNNISMIADPVDVGADFEAFEARLSGADTSSGGETDEAPADEVVTDDTTVDDGSDHVLTDADATADSVVEGAANGTTAGITAFASNADGAVSDVTYSLSADSSNGGFAIDSSTGEITVADGAKLDYEAATSHTVTAVATSADGSTSSETFTIELNDADEFDVSAVSDSDASADQIAENTANGTSVGIAAFASDADGTTNGVTYSLSSDSSNGGFAIDSSTGEITVADGSKLDFEAAAAHEVTVVATSADGSTSVKTFAIAVTDVDEFDVSPVTDADLASDSVAENAANGTRVGIRAFASDADGSANGVTYSLSSDSSNGAFAIDGLTGAVTVADGSKLDFETAASHEVTVVATSADGSTSARTFAIALTDEDEFDVSTVTDEDAAADSVAENAANGTYVGIKAFARDADATNSSVVYSLTSDSSGGGFAIDRTTGAITVADGSKLDFTAAWSHAVTAMAQSADGSTSSRTFDIALTEDPAVDEVAAAEEEYLTWDDWLYDNSPYVVLDDDTIVLESDAGLVTGDPNMKLVIGDDLANAFKSGGENDVLLGQAGDDYLNGQSGDDWIDGGYGADTLIGRDGNDVLIGGGGGDVMYGGDGNDTYVVENAKDEVNEGRKGGDDKIIIASVSYDMTAYTETLQMIGTLDLSSRGTNDDNTMIGNAGNNWMNGRNGDDRLFGGAGDDILIGGNGADIYFGGAGDDKINVRGSGPDVVVYNPGDGYDKIYQFDNGSNLVDLSGFGFSSFDELASYATDTNNGVLFDFGGNDMIRLVGVGLDSVDTSDFIL